MKLYANQKNIFALMFLGIKILSMNKPDESVYSLVNDLINAQSHESGVPGSKVLQIPFLTPKYNTIYVYPKI